MLKLFSVKKRGTLFKAFVESQFKYCPIVWMFHGRRSNSKINKLHERALRIVYDDEVSTLINCFLWANVSVFIIKISRES